MFGNTLNWIGNVSIDWHTAANWECGILPSLNSDVVISSYANFFPTVSANDEIRSLFLIYGATLTIDPPAELKINGQ